MRNWVRLWMAIGLMAAFGSCRKKEKDAPPPPKTVVVYTALDRGFSEPILNRFEKETGIQVLAKYDTESTKTVGLVNALRAEKDRPRCDVFWNNEIVNTLRLKEEGLLQPYSPRAAEPYPPSFKDEEGYWSGFAARARILLVNTEVVPEDQWPSSIADLADPRWKGKTGMAKPLFGTTATHVACLLAENGQEATEAFFEDLDRNEIQILGGNKQVALHVSQGMLAFGMTDTDDAMGELERGEPVDIVYPDADGEGVLFIPNTLALIKGAPHPEAGKRLIEYLLSPEVETALARCGSAQIPLNPEVKVDVPVKGPGEVRAREVDFEAAARCFEEAARLVEAHFLL